MKCNICGKKITKKEDEAVPIPGVHLCYVHQRDSQEAEDAAIADSLERRGRGEYQE